MTDKERIAEIRRSDAFTNAVTVLMDAREDRGEIEGYPEFWQDIREHVYPVLEAKMRGEGALGEEGE